MLKHSLPFKSWFLNFHFPIGILGQVWYLIVSIPDLCTLTYFDDMDNNILEDVCPFITYCVTEFKTYFTVSYFGSFTFYRQIKVLAKNIKVLLSTCRPPPQCKTVVLERGPDGLGFSIVGGHGSPHGDLPIYVKNVFSKGAASENGQLKRGDQILSVNGQSLEGLNHEEAVNILKNAKGSVTMSVLS